jgi:hypothetical protein
MRPELILHVLDDPYLWVLAVLVTAAAVTAGRLRRQPRWATALTVVGLVLLFIGLKQLLTLDQHLLGGALSGGGTVLAALGITRRSPERPPAAR